VISATGSNTCTALITAITVLNSKVRRSSGSVTMKNSWTRFAPSIRAAS
jgi:hypothetical protein